MGEGRGGRGEGGSLCTPSLLLGECSSIFYKPYLSPSLSLSLPPSLVGLSLLLMVVSMVTCGCFLKKVRHQRRHRIQQPANEYSSLIHGTNSPDYND